MEYEPFSSDGLVSVPQKSKAVLMDCDGRVANDLLVAHRALDEDSPEGTLAHEVVDADTLILVVDASAPPEHIEVDFSEFRSDLLEDHGTEPGAPCRGRRSARFSSVCPTKCDLLAKPGDNSSAWMDRIEDRKRDVDAHFREFLARDEADKPRFDKSEPAKPMNAEDIPSCSKPPRAKVKRKP